MVCPSLIICSDNFFISSSSVNKSTVNLDIVSLSPFNIPFNLSILLPNLSSLELLLSFFLSSVAISVTTSLIVVTTPIAVSVVIKP